LTGGGGGGVAGTSTRVGGADGGPSGWAGGPQELGREGDVDVALAPSWRLAILENTTRTIPAITLQAIER
ncbi:MAG: hypothetical protein ACRD03_15790, partial [Acidimicrobiales bacterium]